MRVLALSSSRVGNGEYLAAAVPMVASFLGNASLRLGFVPFAAVDGDYKSYAAKVQEGLSSYTIDLITPANAKEIIPACDAIVVGGGNTFKLLHDIYQHDLFSLIRQKVKNGTPYIGWSAGSNLTGGTICTTNDMPIIQPQSFVAFNFLPFQINPHYYNIAIEGFHGETRDQRLTEFLQLNLGVPVVGLPEGTALQLESHTLQFKGESNGVLFQSNNGKIQKVELISNSDVSFLLKCRNNCEQ